MSERREFEVAVVGLGGIGSGAVYWAARRAGGGVLGLERFELGHGHGASQDHSRIIRLSYHAPEYVRFARDSYAAWAAVEEESGQQLVYRTGGLDLYPENAHGWMQDYTRALDEVGGIAYEWLDAARRDAPLAAVADRRRRPRHVPGGLGHRRRGQSQRDAPAPGHLDGRDAPRARTRPRDP